MHAGEDARATLAKQPLWFVLVFVLGCDLSRV
jgi:hypothetical protein